MKFFDLELGGLGSMVVVYDNEVVGGCLQTTFTTGRTFKDCDNKIRGESSRFTQYTGGLNGNNCDMTYRSSKSCQTYPKP